LIDHVKHRRVFTDCLLKERSIFKNLDRGRGKEGGGGPGIANSSV